MIVVRVTGGLGNQMFQYAFGRHLAERNSTDLKLDLGFYSDPKMNWAHGHKRTFDLSIFDFRASTASPLEAARLRDRVPFDLLDRLIDRMVGFKSSVLFEPHFHFSRQAYESGDERYLIGYWQSEKYFDDIEPLIRADFTFRDQMCESASELGEQILSSNSVCVNVRRGDFVLNPFHGSLGVEYFQSARTMIEKRVSDPTYFVFSDEIDWCEQHLDFDVPTIFVSHEHAGPKFQDYLRLMSMCKHFIIPNSSFAWWAVWFNQDPDRMVIAPKNWFQDPNVDTSDLIPNSWVRI